MGLLCCSCGLFTAAASPVREHRLEVCELQQWLRVGSAVVSRAVELGLSSGAGIVVPQHVDLLG